MSEMSVQLCDVYSGGSQLMTLLNMVMVKYLPVFIVVFNHAMLNTDQNLTAMFASSRMPVTVMTGRMLEYLSERSSTTEHFLGVRPHILGKLWVKHALSARVITCWSQGWGWGITDRHLHSTTAIGTASSAALQRPLHWSTGSSGASGLL